MNGENHQGKTPPGDFKVTTPKNTLLSIIHFGLSRNTNLQLNPYPNTQLDLYCSGNLSLDAWIPVHDQLQQLEEVFGYKVLQFNNYEDQEAPWSQNLWCKDAVASSERIMN